MNDITLSNGVIITHRRALQSGTTIASVKGSDREMTCAEWAEYIRVWMGHWPT